MAFLFFLAIVCVDLKTIMSIERFEHGTTEERVKEIDCALAQIDQYRIDAPTPDEYRVLVAGLRDESPAVRAGTAALLEKIFSASAMKEAQSIAFSREQQLNARGRVTSETLSPYPIEYQKDDEDWMKCCYYLVSKPQIPIIDAYRGFQRFFSPRRCLSVDGAFELQRNEFDFREYLRTTDLAILQYAMRRKIRWIEAHKKTICPELLSQEEAGILEKITKDCACEETKSYAKRILELAKNEPMGKR